MRFDTADADPDASSHADSGDNPHSHANAYPNASPNRYSHADSDANHHSHTNSYSNTHANPHSRANTHSHTNAHSRANTGTDVSTNANAGTDASASTHNTRTYDCHNSRPGDRCNSQSHRHNARYRGGLRLFASAAAIWGSAASVTGPLPHAHERIARDDICSGNQPGSPALHARRPRLVGPTLAFPSALHVVGPTPLPFPPPLPPPPPSDGALGTP